MPPSKHTDDSHREAMRTTWNERAESYRKAMRLFEPYGFDLLARVNPIIRESAHDLATCPVEPTIRIPRIASADVSVDGIELSEQLDDLTTRHAKERQIQGLRSIRM